MFEYIEGVIDSLSCDRVVIDVKGVGYGINIPVSTYDALPAKGENVRIFIHFHVREDIQKLYGFKTKSERDVFRKLISVSKIGPKVAINVLSGLSVKDFIRAVQSGDPTRLRAVSGIGPKTAQRLVMELKGKLNISGIDLSVPDSKTSKMVETDRLSRNDAYDALVSLGYTTMQVVKALDRVGQTIDNTAPVEQWIKKALQVI